MTAKKRFVRKGYKIWDTWEDEEVYELHYRYECRDICRILNNWSEENEQLKQFQDRVFSWIDMHLQRLPTLRDDEFESDNEFADPSLYSGAIQILETMKRELKASQMPANT